MVTFTCDGCNETLKKNKVDAHARKCRDCASVSCVDCSVSFWGDDYKLHTSCISEAERYEKTIYKGPKKNDTNNRKLTPQEKWMEIILQAQSQAPPNSDLQSYLEQIADLENVPRKEKQFRNFASNSLRLFGSQGDKVISSIWKHLSDVRLGLSIEKAKETAGKGTCSYVDDKKETKPQEKSIEQSRENSPKDVPRKDKTSNKLNKKEVKKAMKKTLKKAPNKQMKLKKLRKSLREKLSCEDNDDLLKSVISQIIKKNSEKMKLQGSMISLS